MRALIALVLLLSIEVSFSNTLDELKALEHAKTAPTAIKQEVSTTSSFARDHILVFFLSSTCPYCQKFAPILKEWSSTAHMHILAYTTNGGSLPSFPHPMHPDIDSFKAYFDTQKPVVPALFVLNIHTLQAYPVSQGGLSREALDARMKILIPNISAYEHHTGEGV